MTAPARPDLDLLESAYGCRVRIQRQCEMAVTYIEWLEQRIKELEEVEL